MAGSSYFFQSPHWHLISSPFLLLSPLSSSLPASSCTLPNISMNHSLRNVSKGSCMVRNVHLACTLANELLLFPVLGIYSGIFILFLHLQCPSNDSKQLRTAIILFYAVCVLYTLSTFVIIGDFIVFVRLVSKKTLSVRLPFLISVVQTRSKILWPKTLPESQLLSFLVAQTTVNGCCDFIAQCIIVRINHFT